MLNKGTGTWFGIYSTCTATLHDSGLASHADKNSNVMEKNAESKLKISFYVAAEEIVTVNLCGVLVCPSYRPRYSFSRFVGDFDDMDGITFDKSKDNQKNIERERDREKETKKNRISICGSTFLHALRTFELSLLFLWHDEFDGTVVIILSKSIPSYIRG